MLTRKEERRWDFPAPSDVYASMLNAGEQSHNEQRHPNIHNFLQPPVESLFPIAAVERWQIGWGTLQNIPVDSSDSHLTLDNFRQIPLPEEINHDQRNVEDGIQPIGYMGESFQGSQGSEI